MPFCLQFKDGVL